MTDTLNFKRPASRNTRRRFKLLQAAYDRDGTTDCHYCHCKTILQWDDYVPFAKPPENLASIDRITPGSRGGEYEPSNVVIACRSCNRRRGDERYWEFFLRTRATRNNTCQSIGSDTARAVSEPPVLSCGTVDGSASLVDSNTHLGHKVPETKDNGHEKLASAS